MSLPLSEDEQRAIAEAFAPTMVFHPLERYFPTSSMFPFLDDEDDGAEAPATGGSRPERWTTRVARYEALSREHKLDRAALGYRVFARTRGGGPEVVVEYWVYYVYNAFVVRGTWLPYRVQTNHPHDLERLYLVLSPTDSAADPDVVDVDWARRAFRIRRVVANAHDGSIPPNQYDVPPGETLTAPLTVLVERGSHAMAPDLNRDGRFTPGVDSTTRTGLQWGIRDTGATWSRYRTSFMDPRDGTAVHLCGPATLPGSSADPCGRYVLYPADDLQRWFQELNLSPQDRDEIIGRTSWLVRTFGDIRVEDLMVPRDPPDGRFLEAMLRRRPMTEAGFFAGFKTVALAPAIIVGRRYTWDVPSPRIPDIIVEASGVFATQRRRAFEATVWSSYSVDAITNVVIGAGWISNGRADIAAGLDLRLGRFRVRPTWRIREHALDSRITTSF